MVTPSTSQLSWRPLLLAVGLATALLILSLTYKRRTADFFSAVSADSQVSDQAIQLDVRLPATPARTAPLFSGKLKRDEHVPDPIVAAKSWSYDGFTVNYQAKGEGGHEGFGQNGEDVFAWNHFFHNMRGGTFLEFGALDGISYSNSYIFEHYLNWTGVLIEPGPSNYAKLIHNRPEAACVNAAICSTPQIVHFVENGAVGGIWEFLTPEFIAHWHPGVTVEMLPNITCVPLSHALQTLGVHHINFFSLDVEGAEFEVLKTFDFKKVKVDVLLAEAWQEAEAWAGMAAKNTQVEDLILASGMQLHSIQGHNRWYIHPSFSPSNSNGTST